MSGNRSCLAVLVVLADSGSEHPCTEAGDHTADIVYNRGAREIMHAKRREPAAAPYPVSFNRVDDQRDHCGINAVGFEVCTLCHGSRNDCRSCSAENRFENDKTPQRHCLRNHRSRIVAPDKGIKAADQRSRAAEHQAEADKPEARRTDTEIHHVFHEDIAGVLGSGQTGFAQSEACLHEVDER